MADIAKYVENIKKYSPQVNEPAVAAIVKHLGIALRNRDSSLVSGTDPDEMKRVRESWCKKKLQIAQTDEEIDAACKAVITKMKAERAKERVTVYYLLAEHYKKLDSLVKK
jgi:hypothetical protein